MGVCVGHAVTCAVVVDIAIACYSRLCRCRRRRCRCRSYWRGRCRFRWRRCFGGGATVFAAVAATIAAIFSRAIGADAACDIFFLDGLDVGAALLAVVVGVVIALVSALTSAVALKLRRDRECDAAEICGARMASHCVQLVQNVKQVFCITSAYRFRERPYVTDSIGFAVFLVRKLFPNLCSLFVPRMRSLACRT